MFPLALLLFVASTCRIHGFYAEPISPAGFHQKAHRSTPTSCTSSSVTTTTTTTITAAAAAAAAAKTTRTTTTRSMMMLRPSSKLSLRTSAKSSSKLSMMNPIAAVPQEVWTSLLPPCMGFYKSEWTVSYGYGFGTALTALSIFLQKCNKGIVVQHPMILSFHAAALIFYGTRLSLFLAIRSKLSQRIKEIYQRVEDRAISKGNRFKTRAPFVVSCGFLYYGLCAPLLFTAQLVTSGSIPPTWATTLLQGLIGLQWFGFGMAALADFTKTYVKQTKGDESFLVTSGIFSVLRHPNYTGEIIGWTANALAGLVAAGLLGWKNQPISSSLARGITDLALLGMGWIGITFVLMGATGNLEARQQKDYGNDPKYQTWVDSTWSGWFIPPKPKQPET